MAKLTQSKPEKVAPFDPTKSYKWEPEDIFEITGLQLATLYHTLLREVNDPSGATVAMKYECYRMIMSLMEMGVEQGVIKETSGTTDTTDGKIRQIFQEDITDNPQ